MADDEGSDMRAQVREYYGETLQAAVRPLEDRRMLLR